MSCAGVCAGGAKEGGGVADPDDTPVIWSSFLSSSSSFTVSRCVSVGIKSLNLPSFLFLSLCLEPNGKAKNFETAEAVDHLPLLCVAVSSEDSVSLFLLRLCVTDDKMFGDDKEALLARMTLLLLKEALLSVMLASLVYSDWLYMLLTAM